MSILSGLHTEHKSAAGPAAFTLHVRRQIAVPCGVRLRLYARLVFFLRAVYCLAVFSLYAMCEFFYACGTDALSGILRCTGMNRHSRTQALILASRPAGESNRVVIFLTPQHGVQQAMLYGGRKSRLRSLVSPWHRGTLWLYTDTARGSAKITDFDAEYYSARIRENLDKTWAASVCTEIVMKTEAAGEFGPCWQLAAGFIQGLELCQPENTQTGLLRFMWRYLSLLGQQADCRTCIRCAQLFDGGSPQAVYYSPAENGFVCAHCVSEHEYALPLTTESIRYLYTVSAAPPELSRTYRLSPESFQELRHFLFTLISAACGGQLKTLACQPSLY